MQKMHRWLRGGSTFKELILHEGEIHIYTGKCSETLLVLWCYDMMGIQHREFLLPMVMWKKRCAWGGALAGKEAPDQRQGCVKWLGGSSGTGMVGLLGDKLGSDCGGSFMPSIGLELFLRNAEPLEAFKQGSHVEDTWVLERLLWLQMESRMLLGCHLNGM